jgi:hypothetical protein
MRVVWKVRVMMRCRVCRRGREWGRDERVGVGCSKTWVRRHGLTGELTDRR